MRSNSRANVQQRIFTEEARRAQIITRATDVLSRLGYPQKSFARVAERAGNGAAKQRVLDPELNFDICVDELVAPVGRATRKAVA